MLGKITSGVLGIVVLILVVITFLIPSGMTMFGTPSVVATVGPDKVEYREYQRELERQQQYIGQFYGIKSFTPEQIEKLGLKRNALTSIFQRHWMKFLAEELKIQAPNGAIIQQIETAPYFQKDGKFDVNTYKLVLASNHLTPKDFEADIGQQIVRQLTDVLILRVPQSDNFKNDLNTFAQQRLKVDYVKFDLSSLDKFIKISAAERNAFMNSEEGQKKIKAIFDQRKSSYDVPEQVRVRHLLVAAADDEETTEEDRQKAEKKIRQLAQQITPANFAQLAQKNSDDPGSKAKGGDLGLIRRGMMVGEFEDAAFSLPVNKVSDVVRTNYGYHLILVTEKIPAKEAKIEDYQTAIATELLQQSKRDEEQKLAAQLTEQVEKALKINDTSKLKALQKQYRFTYNAAANINRLQGLPQLTLKESEFADLFSHIGKTFVYKGLDHVIVIKSSPPAPAKPDEVAATLRENENRQYYWGRKLQEDILNAMQAKYPPQVKKNML
ncbi:MAG: SurA N-terminal domain-containing protein [Bacteriovoracaceae bacterium]|nr:SurA N-terminal domain-containing protein [Bacteriovoracaceae bacterium]